MRKQQPIAFMSYVHSDDEHESGRLTRLRERICGEVKLQTGEEFPIFQDRKDIKWGQNWEKRVEESIDGCTFLIPIITPGFFKSEACRNELRRFIKREKELGRNDLILPIYYVGTSVLDDEEERSKNKLAEVVAAHQYVDFRELRFETLTGALVGRAIERLALDIRDALARTSRPQTDDAHRYGESGSPARLSATTAPDCTSAALNAEVLQSLARGAEIHEGPSAKTVPRTLVVDPGSRTGHRTIGAAIESAKTGDRILVRPGLYQETLVIDKPLEIIGDAKLGEVLLDMTGAQCLLFRSTMGRIANLAIRHSGTRDSLAVDIAQGRLELEDCDIASIGATCVIIRGGADPRLRRNLIHGADFAIVVQRNGLGLIEQNEIAACTEIGVVVSAEACSVLRGNRIRGDCSTGVFIRGSGRALLEDNDIAARHIGVAILDAANPILRRNRIHDTKGSGVFVVDGGLGLLEENDIFANDVAGVSIGRDSNPLLRLNEIHDGGGSGVFVHCGGKGMLDRNKLFRNAQSGIEVRERGCPDAMRNDISGNGLWGVRIETAGGTFRTNTLHDNSAGPWLISEDSSANVSREDNVD